MELSDTDAEALMRDGFIELEAEPDRSDPTYKSNRYIISIGSACSLLPLYLLQQCGALFEQLSDPFDNNNCKNVEAPNTLVSLASLFAQYHMLLTCLPNFNRLPVGIPGAAAQKTVKTFNPNINTTPKAIIPNAKPLVPIAKALPNLPNFNTNAFTARLQREAERALRCLRPRRGKRCKKTDFAAQVIMPKANTFAPA